MQTVVVELSEQKREEEEVFDALISSSSSQLGHRGAHHKAHTTSKLLIELAKQEGYTGDDEKSVNLPGEERESLFKVCQE